MRLKAALEARSETRIELGRICGAVLVLGAALSCSCVHHPCDPAYTGPRVRGPEITGYYDYPKRPIDAKIETVREERRYVVKKVEFPSALNVFNTENINVDYYMQKEKGKFPTVLLLPIHGVDFSVTSFARHFASHGFNCAIVHNRKTRLEDSQSAEAVEDYFRQTVLDNRQVLDYLVERNEVDKGKLGCLGLSLGGIRASILSGADERLKCAVVGLAGGSIADVTVLSHRTQIRKHVKELATIGASPEMVRTELFDKVLTDPLRLAPYADARNVLMFIARWDQVIPRECCDRLWESYGKPEVIYLPAGHYLSLLYLPYIIDKSLDFFEEKFDIN